MFGEIPVMFGEIPVAFGEIPVAFALALGGGVRVVKEVLQAETTEQPTHSPKPKTIAGAHPCEPFVVDLSVQIPEGAAVVWPPGRVPRRQVPER